jgi:catechol 2,3-dioxygenase-like lactoylglutathione lyase family enzyme
MNDRRTSHPHLAMTALLVDEYDHAISFFVEQLGFELVEDTALSPTKRWVVVAPGGGGAALLLARATDDAQRAAIGHQAGGRAGSAAVTGTRCDSMPGN